MIGVFAMTAVVLMLTEAPVSHAVSANEASVFADLRATKGSVEWHGLLLGMSESDVEQVLGHQIAAVGNHRMMRPPIARVVRDGRSVELLFRALDGGQILTAIVVKRMGNEDPATWELMNLIRSLQAAAPEAKRAANPQSPTPTGGPELPDVFWFPSASGIRLLLRPDEETIYLGLNEFDD